MTIDWRTAICLLAILLTYQTNANTNDGYGPLQSYTQSPFHTNSLSPQLRSGFSMPVDHSEVYASGIVSSIWAVTDQYELDYYQNQLAIGGKWQWNERWQVDLNYRWNYAGNNHLDRLTIAFHDWVGLEQNGRTEVNNDRFVINMPEYGIELEGFRSETLSHVLTGYLQYQIMTHSNHGLSIGASLYYNDTNHGIFSSSDFEQALQINYGYQREKHGFDTSVAITFRNTPTVFKQIPYRNSNWSLGASYRYQWLPNHALIGQFAVHQGITTDESEFSKPSTEFTFGYRYRLKNSAVEITAVENMFNADNSTDIAFGVTFRYRFGAGES
ncbi:DUF3187 family protein [Vibrio sp. NH-UV-68]|uniref:DUF3187 family protein n=1 Tax=unclassified Vibrio TaxID=2614977 RepID=UPI0036F2B730